MLNAIEENPGRPAPSKLTSRLALALSTLVVGLGLLIFSPNYRWAADKGESPYGSDFLQDWTAGRMILAGQAAELYNAPQFDRWQHDPQQIGFTWNPNSYYPSVYPPPYYLLVSPMAWLYYRWAAVLWLALMCAAYFAAGTICELGLAHYETRKTPLDPHQPTGMNWFWPAMLLFPASLLCFSMGQKGTLWLLLWAGTWYWHHQGKPFVAGLIFGILSIKPTLFFLLPLIMLWNGQWKFLSGASISFAGIWLAAALLLPSHVWSEFLQVARGAGDYHQHAGYQLHWSSNLASYVSVVQHRLPPVVTWLILATLVGYVLLKTFGISKFNLNNALHLGSALLATSLLSPHFYSYDLVVLLLPLWALWNSQRQLAVVGLCSLWLGMMASPVVQQTLGIPLMPLMLLALLAFWNRFSELPRTQEPHKHGSYG